MKKWLPLICVIFLTSCSQPEVIVEDERQYAHGVSIIGQTVLWSQKSEEQRDDGWTHDIYSKRIGQSNIQTLVSNPEAQEPVNASVNEETIILTYEDGYDAKNNIAQRYKLYTHDWQSVYEGTLFDGGHSGHVASTATQHVIFWSNEWVNGGGVNELGTGKEVIVSTLSNEGTILHETKLSHIDDRDSWPLVAASDDNALLIWQHFNEDATKAALYHAVYDPKTNTLTQPPTELVSQVVFYTYSVSFVEETNQYVVAAQTHEDATLLLLAKDGTLLDQIAVPSLVNESTPAVRGTKLIYPQMPNQYFTVEVSQDKLRLQPSKATGHTWGTTGTAGVFLKKDRVYFATLDEGGLREVILEIDRGQ